MTNFVSRLLRAVVFVLLGLAGMAMAFFVMTVMAVTVGVLYIVSRVRGKPFGARAWWSQARTRAPGIRPFDVIDVEAREIR